MIFDSFIGSGEVRSELSAVIKQGTLPHAVLIIGQTGCGTGYFARLLAADLICQGLPAQEAERRCRAVLQQQDEDVLHLRGTGASGQIPVDAVREIRSQAIRTSLSGTARVVILHGADHLNASSANALLKILEEPPEGVYLLITAPSADALLPTVRSRCSTFQLDHPSVQECADYLIREGVESVRANQLAVIFQGRIGAAIAAAQPANRQIFADALAACEAIGMQDAWQLMQIFVGYEKTTAKKDGAKQDAKPKGKVVFDPAARETEPDWRAKLYLLLQYLTDVMDTALHEQDCVPVSAALAAAALPAVSLAMQQLRQNAQPKLVLTALAVRLGS